MSVITGRFPFVIGHTIRNANLDGRLNVPDSLCTGFLPFLLVIKIAPFMSSPMYRYPYRSIV